MGKILSCQHVKAGFTLLELLIALFIFTLVSVIMVSALHSVLGTQSRTEIQSERFAALQRALVMMTSDIQQAINRPIMNAKGFIDPTMIGSPTRVAFTHAGFANPAGQLERTTLQRVSYFWDHDNLIRESWPVLDQSPKTISSQRVILDTATALQFSYLDHQGVFQNNWPPPSQADAKLPAAIRIEITLKNWGTLNQLTLLPESTIVKVH